MFQGAGDCAETGSGGGMTGEHPQAEFLKYKSWYLNIRWRDEVIRDADGFLNWRKRFSGK